MPITSRSLRRRTLSLHQQLPISKADLRLGLQTGSALVQFDEKHVEVSPIEQLSRHWIEELLHDGLAWASEWKEHPRLGKTYRVVASKPLTEAEIKEII